MSTIYNLPSAADLDSRIVEEIKAMYKSKPITIIVEEDINEADLSLELKELMDEESDEDDSYFSEEESIEKFKNKYRI